MLAFFSDNTGNKLMCCYMLSQIIYVEIYVFIFVHMYNIHVSTHVEIYIFYNSCMCSL